LITTPYGNPLEVDASYYLSSMQDGSMQDFEHDIKLNTELYMKWTQLPELFYDTVEICKNAKIPSNLVNIQGRLICTNLNLFKTNGNVIINTIDKNNIDDSYTKHLLLKIATSLIYDIEQLQDRY
jgi:hypothetical protein